MLLQVLMGSSSLYSCDLSCTECVWRTRGRAPVRSSRTLQRRRWTGVEITSSLLTSQYPSWMALQMRTAVGLALTFSCNFCSLERCFFIFTEKCLLCLFRCLAERQKLQESLIADCYWPDPCQAKSLPKWFCPNGAPIISQNPSGVHTLRAQTGPVPRKRGIIRQALYLERLHQSGEQWMFNWI